MFERKQRNRRLNRVHVLDVKLRSDQVRRSRQRLGALVVGTLLGTVFGAYVLWRAGGWALDRLVYTNPAFAIRAVEVQSNGVISAGQVRRWANVRVGENLLALDLARVKRDLELVPRIATVSLERILPRTLRIRVTEREAVAQATVPRRNAAGHWEAAVYHLDAEGVVMWPLSAHAPGAAVSTPEEELPALVGIRLNELQPGGRVSSAQGRAALELVSRFARSPMAGLVDLQQVDAATPGVLVVRTEQGSEVTFGLNDFDQQFRRWRKIHELGLQLKRNVATIDLAVSNNVPVRWLEATVAPPPAKPPKTTRPRKRNV